MNFEVILGILIPLIGTTLGALTVYFLKNNVGKRFQTILLGFASGVMIAASIFSLLLPAIDSSAEPRWLPASIGLLSGIIFLMIVDRIFPKLHKDMTKINSSKKKNFLLFFAITIHNIPEGMAVGVAFASCIYGGVELTLASAFVLSVGIALQNFPEGAILSLPLKAQGQTKNKAFLLGFASGVVEPIFALLTILLFSFLGPLLPYLLAFASGAMIYVVVCELIPEFRETKHSNWGIISFAFGFILMMIFDIAFG